MNLFIANLSPASTTKDLQQLFSHYGIVTTVKVIIDRVTGRSKRYGFVEMPNNYEAKEAMAELNNTSFQENLILVRESQPTGNWNHRNDRQRIARNSGYCLSNSREKSYG